MDVSVGAIAGFALTSGALSLSWGQLPSPFSNAELRLTFLIRGKLGLNSVQRDNSILVRSLPIPVYWICFAVWQLIITAGGMLAACLVSWVVWKFSGAPAPRTAPHEFLVKIGALSATFGGLIIVAGWMFS